MGLILLVFENAFDSIERDFMRKTLGPVFQRKVKTIYTDIYSTVINNGFSSSWFSIKLGVRQGCPLATTLFVKCVDILVQKHDKTMQ